MISFINRAMDWRRRGHVIEEKGVWALLKRLGKGLPLAARWIGL